MGRIYNFAAGPAVLPEQVLKKAAAEMLDYKGSGMSVMEMSHRSKVYEEIIQNAESLLRKLMDIPDNYSVLFLQGGASTQFAMVPMNLLTGSGKADYINTGSWSKKAISEAKLFGVPRVIASSEDKNFSYIPKEFTISEDADYVHITTNNTIEGTRFTSIPETGRIPLVADMSSNILSEKTNVSAYGLIYAGAQKNLGPSGVTIVIIRKDLIGKHSEKVPTMLRYSTHAEADSLYNTPPCYSIYIAGLVLQWLDDIGGVDAIEAINKDKASLLYDYLGNTDFFKSPVNTADRSLMNVPFVSPSEELDARFVREAEKAGFSSLKGHRSVGGMRASIYNAMPVEGVKALVTFMKKFESANRKV
ncbi:MAG: 3-phosphoserine/phosphohydroxythreonine transaminase [Eubacteriales bacterium]|nr:3-phosphoserine/phosphohydroxythreonine transaminase [Eubacteriales bacterium]